MEIIKRLESEGLEVIEDKAGYYVIEDSEGHTVVMDILNDTVLIMDNEGIEEEFYIKQDNMIIYSVLSALDYDFDE